MLADELILRVVHSSVFQEKILIKEDPVVISLVHHPIIFNIRSRIESGQ